MTWLALYLVVGLVVGCVLGLSGGMSEPEDRQGLVVWCSLAAIPLWPLFVTVFPAIALGWWLRKRKGGS